MTTGWVADGDGPDPLARLDVTLGAAREAMVSVETWSLPTDLLPVVLATLERLVRAAQAAQLSVVGEMASRGEMLVPPGLDPATAALQARGRAADGRLALAGALGVHPATAARRQATVAFVTGSGLPAGHAVRAGGAGAGLGEGGATGKALADGRISAEVADVVAATVLDLPEHYGRRGRAAVEAVLLTHAPEVALTTLRHHARGLLARAETEGAVPGAGDDGPPGREGDDLLGRAEERAHRRRELFCSPDLHGTWHLRGRLAPEAGATVAAALEALAAPEPSDAHGPDLRSAAQRRADALLRLADRALASPPGSATGLPHEGGARARVVVTADLSVLTGAVRGAGLLADDAPLSAGAVRRLACDAELVPAVLGTASEPLDVGRSAYVVSPAQRRALALRDRGCRAPDCSAPPSRSHAHHVRHWADGGSTDLANLVLLCGHDHRRVHRGELDVHVVDGRPVVVRAGDGPPVEAPPPWRARLEGVRRDLDAGLRLGDVGTSPPPAAGAEPARPATDPAEVRLPSEGAGHGGVHAREAPAPPRARARPHTDRRLSDPRPRGASPPARRRQRPDGARQSPT